MDESAVAEPTRAEELPATPAVDVEDELLIEEISIDGMCGVY
jgi:mycofactocin precursor